MADPITQVGALTLRGDVGRELTHAEGDANLKTLRDFSNMMAQWVEGGLDDEGTFKDGAVREARQIANRIITADHLDLSALNFYEDAGDEDNIYLIKLGGPGSSELRLAELPSITSGKSILIWMYSKRANTGPSYLKIEKSDNVFHDNILIKKRNNSGLLPNDIQADELVCLVYEPTSSTFRLIGGAGSSTGTASATGDINFTGLTEYSSPQGTELTGSGTHSFFHYLAGTPSHIQAYLECSADDAGYEIGDRIPVEQFFDGNLRSFSVQWNSTSIVVEELSNIPNIIHRTDGTLDAIVLDNWMLYVKAWVNKSVATITFPDLQFGFGGIAFGYNEKFYGWNWNHDGNIERFYGVDLKTRNVSRIKLDLATGVNMDAVRRYHQSGTVWRKADGTDWLLVNDHIGWYQVLLTSPWTTKLVGTGANWNYRPVWLDEGGVGQTANPDTFALEGGYWGSRVSRIEMRRMAYNGSIYQGTQFGTQLDLQDSNITNVSAFTDVVGANPYVMQVQYNPHNSKRRLYVWERNTFSISIFNIIDYTSPDITQWWVAAGRYGTMTYEKSIILPPVPMLGSPQVHNKFSVEWNLDTGQEIAIWTSRETHSGSNSGHVTRTPWVE